MSRVDRISVWYCPSCSAAIGSVVNGELELSNSEVRTIGINVTVVCPECGKEKIWYPQVGVDQVVRVFAREFERVKS